MSVDAWLCVRGEDDVFKRPSYNKVDTPINPDNALAPYDPLNCNIGEWWKATYILTLIRREKVDCGFEPDDLINFSEPLDCGQYYSQDWAAIEKETAEIIDRLEQQRAKFENEYTFNDIKRWLLTWNQTARYVLSQSKPENYAIFFG